MFKLLGEEYTFFTTLARGPYHTKVPYPFPHSQTRLLRMSEVVSVAGVPASSIRTWGFLVVLSVKILWWRVTRDGSYLMSIFFPFPARMLQETVTSWEPPVTSMFSSNEPLTDT